MNANDREQLKRSKRMTSLENKINHWTRFITEQRKQDAEMAEGLRNKAFNEARQKSAEAKIAAMNERTDRWERERLVPLQEELAALMEEIIANMPESPMA